MAWDPTHIPDLNGRIVVITGGNAGLGLATARVLAERGAHLVLACRNPERGREAAGHLVQTTGNSRVETVTCDLADLRSVAAGAKRLEETLPRVDVLINNAGIMAVPRSETAQGFEKQFGVNHLGHFALTGHLLALLHRGEGRVTTVSSFMHWPGRIDFDDLMGERRYERWTAYCQSKLANLMFAWELQRRSDDAGAGLISTAAHPGYAATGLQQTGAESGNVVTGIFLRLMTAIWGQSAAGGALPTLRAATEPGLRGGEFFGPRWVARGRPVRARSSRRSQDPGLAGRLWERSVELTGVEFDFSAPPSAG